LELGWSIIISGTVADLNMHIGPSPIAIKALFYLVGRRALEFKTDRNEMGLIISENVLKMQNGKTMQDPEMHVKEKETGNFLVVYLF